MQLVLERWVSNAKSTIGVLSMDTKFVGFTCEDAYHQTKIPGETRIPAGKYKIHLKELGSSRMDPWYSQKFNGMHKGMLELLNVPNYAGVLIHIGNTGKDTEGCILVGLGANAVADMLGSFQVISSQACYMAMYPKIRDALLAGREVIITIVDKDR